MNCMFYRSLARFPTILIFFLWAAITACTSVPEIADSSPSFVSHGDICHLHPAKMYSDVLHELIPLTLPHKPLFVLLINIITSLH